MLSVIPAGIFSRLRIFLGRLKPHALPVARRHIVLGSIGAGTGLAVTSMFSHWLLGEVNLWFIAPMGPRRYSCLAYRAAAGAAVVDCRRQRAVGADRCHGGYAGPRCGAGLRSGGGSGHRRDVFSALSASPAARWP